MKEIVGYQFQVDSRAGASPVRPTWNAAAQDCVDAGYGHWALQNAGRSTVMVLKLSSEAGAEIKRIRR